MIRRETHFKVKPTDTIQYNEIKVNRLGSYFRLSYISKELIIQSANFTSGNIHTF